MAHVTVPARPLLSVGTFNASTGEEVITEADLHAIVAASHSGALDNAVVKIGHNDERFALGDGEPAYGQVTNLRVVDGTLYGDYVNVPNALAESLSSAYPSVSVELARNVKLRDQKGQVAHAFDVVLTAAALLGATPPAVKGLSQRAYAFSEDQLDYTTFIDHAEVFPDPDVELAAKKKTAPKSEPKAEPESKAEPEAQEPAAEQTAPRAADAPEDRDEPAEQPDTTSASTEEPGNDGDTPEVPPRHDEITDASPEDDAPAPQQDTPAPPAQQGATEMPNIDEQAAALRRKYDLPDNASYKDLLSKVLDEKVVAGVNQDPVTDVRPGSDETPREEVDEQIADETQERQKHNLSESAQDGEQAKAQAPSVNLDDVYVSKSAFSQLMEEFETTKAELAARKAAEVKAHRDGLVTSWFRAGIIGKDERETVREELDKSESTVVALMERRTPIYPVVEVGHGVNDSAHFALDTDETKTEKLYEADDAIFGA